MVRGQNVRRCSNDRSIETYVDTNRDRLHEVELPIRLSFHWQPKLLGSELGRLLEGEPLLLLGLHAGRATPTSKLLRTRLGGAAPSLVVNTNWVSCTTSCLGSDLGLNHCSR
jgi:hypothetical protein